MDQGVPAGGIVIGHRDRVIAPEENLKLAGLGMDVTRERMLA